MRANVCNIALLLALSFLILTDQVSKYLIRAKGGFYICNANLAFGLKLIPFLILVLILVSIFFLTTAVNPKYKSLSSKQTKNSSFQNSKRPFIIFDLKNFNLFRISDFGFSALAFVLILSGALSNIMDRLSFGCVIDFIDLKFWPVFNLADVFITIGAIIILVKSRKVKSL